MNFLKKLFSFKNTSEPEDVDFITPSEEILSVNGVRHESIKENKWITKLKFVASKSDEQINATKGSKAADSQAGKTFHAIVARNSSLATNNKILIGLLGICVFKLVFMNDPVVVVRPPNQTKDIVITGNKANEEYKKQWGLSIATLIGNINKNNVEFITNYVVSMLAPKLQAQNEQKLRGAAALLAAKGIDQTFTPSDITYDSVNDVVYVWGTKKTTLLNVSKDPETSKWTYEIVLGINNGAPRIAYLDQYAGMPNLKKSSVNGVDLASSVSELPDVSGAQ